MLNILSRITRRITGGARAEIKDAKRVYQIAMEQSRQPAFYGEDLCADTTNGRMEILCLHLSTIIYALRDHGDTGAKLTQALYDVMIDDFDVALREEGLADTGVKRRIKPLAKMFFARAKQYAEAFNEEHSRIGLEAIINEHICKTGDNNTKFIAYVQKFHANLANQSVGDIARGKLDFPKFL